MSSKFFQRLRHQACVVLFGIVLISACTVSAGAVFTESSGDGQVVYGSYILPDFSSNYGGSFPYAVMGNYWGVAWQAIVFSKQPFITNDSLYITAGTSYGLFSLEGNSWVSAGFDTTDANISLLPNVSSTFTEIWTNEDILDYTSREVVYSGSDPFPLDDFNYVSWDGDVTGLQKASFETALDYFYFGSFDESIYRSSYEIGRSYRTGVGYFDLFTPVVPVENESSYLLSDHLFSSLALSVSDDPLGLYFLKQGDLYLKYFIYPDSVPSAVIDFSQTTLTASNPQYDYQSAEFDISWSNLPDVPYPDNVQYFIQGRLNDGSASQPPELYLGSSSDPPTSDVPVSFSFSGLQPETQYTATFELVYNSTGSFKDFTRSGITATVSFTTLSDGSISEGDKAIINAIQQGNKDNQQWADSQFGSSVGDLPQDTSETDNLISGLDQQEEAYKDDAYDRFQELSSAFSGFDGSVGSGIGLAGTLFSRFFNALGSYKIIYTFPLLLGLAMVLIGRLGRSSIRMEREPGDQFKIDGW